MALVLNDLDRGVLTITLHNTERRNAWNLAVEREYFDSLERAGRDEAVRAIVITGSGRFFCPGMDTARLADEAAGEQVQFAGRRPQHFPLTIPKPMIVAINGACAGIGLLQALLCDVRFVARGARLSTAYARRGLPAEYGTSWLLTRLVGTELAADLLLSARTFDGVEAHAIGLASRLCDDDSVLAAAQQYARDIAANCSPTSMAVIRRQLWGDLDLRYTEANARWLEVMRQFNRPENTDFAEGVASFVERRTPHFAPLSPSWPLPEPLEFAPQE